MTSEKFIYEVTAVTKFSETYCDDKHADAIKTDGAALHDYKEDKGLVQTRFHLCADCERMLRYAYARIRVCPHAENRAVTTARIRATSAKCG